ncbi:MAG TPA: hypothetical protein VN750_00690 [Steroidobacteraceae bacterium]|nr:hypothetical protein [Steroidobacteraceae bacterium]
MSTSTTHRSGTLAYVGVGAAPDDPQFHVRFTPENDPAAELPANSFRWIGWATLHIGAHGVLVSARRRGWMGFNRRERRFFTSAEIRNVYREGGAVHVELTDTAAGPQGFQFWPPDLKTAATIVALLPTANTVEIDAPAPSEPATPARHRSVWIFGAAATLIAALVGVGIVFLHQSERTLQAAGAVTVLPVAAAAPGAVDEAAKLAAAPDPEIFSGLQEFERIEPQIEGLKTQFSTALTALQLGALSQVEFSDGLETWLIPQWRTLSNEVGESTPAQSSARYDLHEDLVNATLTWESALESYANGLRDRDTERNLAAFGQLRHAADLEQDARRAYATLERQSDPASPTP